MRPGIDKARPQSIPMVELIPKRSEGSLSFLIVAVFKPFSRKPDCKDKARPQLIPMVELMPSVARGLLLL